MKNLVTIDTDKGRFTTPQNLEGQLRLSRLIKKGYKILSLDDVKIDPLKGLTYLCENSDFSYYRDSYDELIMVRKWDQKIFEVSAVNEGELYKDIENDWLIKIAPEFINDFHEIQKELPTNKTKK